ncbi:MAG: porin [Oceanospirillaceae bacterium]|nr:porin [Oceanospirillaceae bacterium]MCP5351526.1 porin [Oceanospirillaceae bacterium]
MKKIALATAIMAAGFAQATLADGPVVYGKLHLNTNYVDRDVDGEDAFFTLESQASRIGVKGSDEAGAFKAVYQLEYETYVDSGSKTLEATDSNGDDVEYQSTLSQRDSFVGLSGGFGTVVMGYMDTPLKKSQGNFDLFNDYVDIKNVFDGENRLGNQINYTTNDMNGIKASVSVLFAEDGESGNGTSASITYAAKGLYVSLAADENLEELDAKKDKGQSTQRLTALYTMGQLTAGVMAQKVDKADTKDKDMAYAVNAAYVVGAETLKAQYETGDQKAKGATQLSLGLDHQLGKSTVAYVYASQYEDDADNSGVNRIGFGLVQKF